MSQNLSSAAVLIGAELAPVAEAALELQMINENIQHTCFLSKLMKTIAINLSILYILS